MKKVISPMIDRIKRGAALLDKKIPEWEERQPLDFLNMKSACSCILGWSEDERDYWGTIRKLFPLAQDELELSTLAYEHGFNIQPHEHGLAEEDERYYASLTAEWKKFIQERRLSHVSRAN